MRGFTIFALVLTACAVELAPLEADKDGGAGTGANGNGGGGSGGTGGPLGSGGTPAGGFGGVPGGGTGSGGTGGTPDACTSCVAQKCAVPDAACKGSAACGSLNACLLGCTTPACQTTCYGQHDAYDLYYELESCVYQLCPVDCGVWSMDCWSCDQTNCIDPLSACLNEYDCLAFWNCVGTCPDEPCFNSCVDTWPLGAQADFLYQDCSYGLCQPVCY